VLRGIGPGVELAGHRRRRQQVGVGHQLVHRIDTGVQVVLDDVVVAAVRVGDLVRDLAARDAIDVVGRDVERIDDVGDGVVHALDQLVPAADEEVGVGPLVQFAIGCRLDDDVGLRQQLAHHLHHVVQVGLDDVEVAVVVVGDHRRDDALGNVVNVLRRHVERIDHAVQSVVHAFDNAAVLARVLAGIGAGGQAALLRSIGQHAGIVVEGPQRPLNHLQ